MVTSLARSQDQSSQERPQTCSPSPVSEAGLFPSKRAVVYVDGANFFYGLRSLNKGYSDAHFDFQRFIRKLTTNHSLVAVRYYNASLKRDVNPRVFDQQQVLFKRLRALSWNVVLCRRVPRTEAGTTYYQIKGDDIHLAIDMLKDAYENVYDTAILISSDGDFAPVVQYVQALGKRVENVHFNGLISRNLLHTCDVHSAIDKRVANKYFYRMK